MSLGHIMDFRDLVKLEKNMYGIYWISWVEAGRLSLSPSRAQ